MVSAKNKANWEKGFGNWVVESGLTEEKVSDNDRMYLCYRFKINSPLKKNAGWRRMRSVTLINV